MQKSALRLGGRPAIQSSRLGALCWKPPTKRCGLRAASPGSASAPRRPSAMRRQWAQAIAARAEAHWTDEQTFGQFGKLRLILPPRTYAPLLRALDLLRADATMSPASVRKYMQTSQMLTLLEPTLRLLAERNDQVRILDLACGNSYLSLLLATSLEQRIRRPWQILGVDRKAKLIAASKQRAWYLELEHRLRFATAELADFYPAEAWSEAFESPAGTPIAHMLVALHACDTATDLALALAIREKIPEIAVVPCCQAELAREWADARPEQSEMVLSPLAGWPHMRRDAGATMTDALRTLILEGCGYSAAPVEFVPSAHTPKNTMIRASLSHEPLPAGSFGRYLALRRALGNVRLTLERILPSPHRERLLLEEGLVPATGGLASASPNETTAGSALRSAFR